MSEKRLYRPDGSYIVEQEGTTLGTGTINKSKKYNATYPPAAFTSALADFRKKINRFPKDLFELGALNIQYQEMIQEMKATNYEDLDVLFSGKDSIVIQHQYQKYSKQEMAEMKKLSTKIYDGTYTYIYYNENIYVVNELKKPKLIRFSRD